MSASLSPLPKLQFFDANGNPLVGGKLYTFAAGTTTPLATYTDNTGTIAASNPIVLNGRGECEVWLGGAPYKFRLETSAGVEVWTVDNVTQANADQLQYTPAATSLLSGVVTTVSGGLNELSHQSTGSTRVGFLQAGTGAQARTVQSKLRDVVSVKDFGAVGDGVADDTAAIQACINWASANRKPVVYIPRGQYKISTLYMTYDAVLNPGFSTAAGEGGRMTLVGDGRCSASDIANWNTRIPTFGTVLVSTATTTSAIVMATAAQDANPYPVRRQWIKGMTVAANTSAWVIENNASPEWSGLEDVAAVQLGTTGGGVLWRSSWYTYFKGVAVGQPSGVNSSGVGLQLGSSIFAGLYEFISCSFTRFTSAVRLINTSSSANYSFINCGFESASQHGIRISSAVRNISIRDCYWEFNGVNHVLVDTVSITNSAVK